MANPDLPLSYCDLISEMLHFASRSKIRSEIESLFAS